ncbi:trigger factor domain [Chloroherpeton thalassium ATCC 35110]|uniref:Trigger factor n=1 Tax=Chloroherpeton thalassium (strain ATCC 35110 / GB-78) TaxID=517418 RepID=TIG_CHLT3|nr:trigger factor [Chloroherpeton thalassium]B3QXY8.1 RecName: Full=Trigger factor; Short=TF; AltName: Full=PPIase [Chloroherpeton thalassium ATCC 35110]ACF13516.1 trigger factor domain [Chloroherpeton thalassium ATCC 35110]
MESKFKQLSDTEQELEISFSPDEFQPELDKQYKLAQAKAHLKGFRKGKAPLQMIKKMLGRDIQYQVVEELAGKNFESVAKENDLKLVGQAKIRHYELAENEKLSIYLIYEVHPAFELKPFNEYEFKKAEYQVSDETVEKELKKLLQSKGNMVAVEGAAAPTDIVIGDVQKLDADGTAIVGERQENQSFRLEYMKDDSPFFTALNGVNKGEERRVEVEVKEEDVPEENKKQTFLISVKEIKRMELPELTDELVKELSRGKNETVQDFRDELRKQIEAYFTNKSEEDLMESVAQKFLEENVFTAPSSLIKMYEDMLLDNAKRQIGGAFPPGFDETYYRAEIRPNAEKHARWMLIRNKIAELNGIEVSDDDIKALAEKEAKLTGAEATEEFVNTYFSEQYKPYVIDTLLRDKIYEFIKANTKIEVESKLPEAAV